MSFGQLWQAGDAQLGQVPQGLISLSGWGTAILLLDFSAPCLDPSCPQSPSSFGDALMALVFAPPHGEGTKVSKKGP